jgi:hypothetical protein
MLPDVGGGEGDGFGGVGSGEVTVSVTVLEFALVDFASVTLQ